MLHPVEVLPGTRRAVRRAVHVDCEVVSRFWDDSIPHLATNLTPDGVWIESSLPLEVGEDVVLTFRPPRWEQGREVTCFGTVRRVDLRRRTSDPRSAGMGIEFLDIAEHDREDLARSLRGLPPPLPPRGARARFERELVWLDMLLSWEEDLGDRVNTFELSEHIGLVADCDFEIEPLGELQTGSKPAYEWIHAA